MSHDIHHQPYGFKKNFSQPFGSFWDHILGTHMSREEANAIVRKKEERRRNRQAFNVKSMDSSTRTKEKSSSLLSKHDSVRSSGDNSGNVSQEDGQSYHVKSLNIPQNIENRAGLHERSSTRIQFDNGFVSGKGQGKAL
ncbi:hypothetical protein BGZ49_000337 [Haplosporangium sp. Z 27]|nr:hypothetical protein BGZ49_000337 [Haplosporangium sp. Z 27]